MTSRPALIARNHPSSGRSPAPLLLLLLSSGVLMACTEGTSRGAPRAGDSVTDTVDPQTVQDASSGLSAASPSESGPGGHPASPEAFDAARTGPGSADGGTGPASAPVAPLPAVDASGAPVSAEPDASQRPVARVDAGASGDAASTVASIYDDDSKWLCRPGLPNNPCLDTIQITDVQPDGGTSVSELPKTPADVQADCLYLYPTIDVGLFAAPRNLDFDQIDKETVRSVFAGQGVPFREACAIWAPLYRQTSLQSFGQPDTREQGLETAFHDLEQAFDYYLRHADARRPIVIIAHSQGSIVMTRLLARRFEGHPDVMRRLVVAVLAGPLGGFVVPEGKLVGGTLQEIPLCTSDQQTGCALTYSTFSEKTPPNADYGNVNGGVKPGFDTGCTTPPGGLDGEAARMSGALFASNGGVVGLIAPLLDYGPLRVQTQLVRYADFYTARCEKSTRGLSYLSIAAAPLAGDLRVDPVIYDSAALSSADIGLHALDYAFVSADLLRSVKTRILAYGK